MSLYNIRRPQESEVPGIKALIDRAVVRGHLLPRTHAELYEHRGEFFVYVDEKGVGGCCALRLDTPEIGEIWSLVVREDLRGHQLGVQLLQACVNDAKVRGAHRVYALSRSPEFFRRLDFQEIDRYELPFKITRDCIQCRQFMHCEAVAMIRAVDGVAPEPPAEGRKE